MTKLTNDIRGNPINSDPLQLQLLRKTAYRADHAMFANSVNGRNRKRIQARIRRSTDNMTFLCRLAFPHIMRRKFDRCPSSASHIPSRPKKRQARRQDKKRKESGEKYYKARPPNSPPQPSNPASPAPPHPHPKTACSPSRRPKSPHSQTPHPRSPCSRARRGKLAPARPTTRRRIRSMRIELLARRRWRGGNRDVRTRWRGIGCRGWRW